MTLKTISVIEGKLSNKTDCIKDDNESKEWPQVLAILSAALATVTCGILFTWPSPSIPILISPTFPGNITMTHASYLTVFPPVAAALSSPLFAYLVDLIGRKPTLLSIAVPHLAAWTIIASTDSIYLLYISRFLAGIGDACVFAVVPTYIAEVATPKVRGTWGNAMTILIFFGQFAMNAVGAFFTIRTTAFVLMTVPALFLVSFACMPETPYYLIMKGREDEARRSMRWLRRKQDVEVELQTLCGDVKRQLSEPGSYRHLFTIDSNRRAVFIGAVSRMCQQFCGISAFAVYTKTLFEEAGGNVSATTSALIFTGAMTVVNFFTGSALDRIGRRRAMILSCIGCAISLFSVSIFLYLNQNTDVDLSAISWFPILGMTFFVVSICIGLAIVPNMLLGELFSSSIKGKALCIMNICFAVYVASSTKLFQVLMTSFGLYVPFAFYAVCCLCSTVVSYYIIPETTGKTLEEIQQDLKGKKK